MEMGSACSSHSVATARRKRKGSGDVSHGSSTTEGSTVRSSLRHSIVSAIPDGCISDLYPVEDNYVSEPDGRRSPKSLAALATEAVCRSLPYLEGDLPHGLPQDVVDDILHSLTMHSAVNATTLRALGKCELSVLSLANCRGVTDSWLEPLANKTSEASPPLVPLSAGHQIEELLLDHDHEDREIHVCSDSVRSEDGSSSSASFVSSYMYEPILNTPMSNSMEHDGPSRFDGDNQNDGPDVLMEDTKQSAQSIHFEVPPTFTTTNITLLDLRGSQRLSDRGLMHLTDLSCLEIAKLDNCHSIQGRGLLALASSHRLHTLTLSNCRRLTDEAVINISHLLSLEVLSLHGCRCITDRSLAAMGDLYNLNILDVGQCDLVSDQGIEMLRSLELLEEFQVGWCRNLTDRAVEILTKQHQRSTNLRILGLARCNITDEGVSMLSSLHALEQLDLNGCSKITSAALGRSIELMENLEILDVSYCPGILRSSFQGKIQNLKSLELCYSAVRDTHIYKLQELPALVELNLDSCPITDSGMRHLADSNVVPNLTSLDLADTDLTDEAMAHIAKFPKLQRLSLFYCNITNSGLRHLAKLHSLEVLNLDSRDISDDGLKYLPRNLKALDLFSGRISDSGCGHISKIKTLESLELCGGGVGDLGCSFLAGLENLRSLNLSQNERISNRGAAALASLSNLKALNLSNTRVSGSALRFFSGLKQLQSLALYGCNGVGTGSGITSLQNVNPNLKCIRVHNTTEDEGTVVNEGDNHSSDEFWTRPQEPEHMHEEEEEEMNI